MVIVNWGWHGSSRKGGRKRSPILTVLILFLGGENILVGVEEICHRKFWWKWWLGGGLPFLYERKKSLIKNSSRADACRGRRKKTSPQIKNIYWLTKCHISTLEWRLKEVISKYILLLKYTACFERLLCANCLNST